MTDADEAGLVQPMLPASLGGKHRALLKALSTKAAEYHDRVPGIRRLPFSAVAIIVILIAINICVWIAAGIVLVHLSIQLKTALHVDTL